MKAFIHGKTIEVNFKWDMSQTELEDLNAGHDDNLDGLYIYDGAVFFGDFKIEFIRNENPGRYLNMYQYGIIDHPGEVDAYAYLEDGAPYEDRDEQVQSITIRTIESFPDFALDIELQILDMLGEYPELIQAATRPTDPDKWYPAGRPYKIDEITRDV